MVKKYKLCSFIIVLLLCGCIKNIDKKTINIAVTGSPSVYSEYYEKGIKKAYTDVCDEYKDRGFDIKCEFYEDNDDYETGEKITARLVNDSSITAIIASSSAEICENQVYQTDKTDKILICPHWMYDSTLEEGNYSKVFSLNYSSENIGAVMKNIAQGSSAKKWAVCYSDDKISKAEIKCFNNVDNDIHIVDSIKINALISDFNRTVDRWKMLGVEGVILIPYENEGFDLLYRLKAEMPELYIISDSSLDDDNELQTNRKYFDKVYIVDSFFVTSEESEIFANEEYLDTWEIHGYNALRMTVDTAVENDTDDPIKIAEILHKNGYIGELESYKFNEKGTLNSEKFSYIEIKKDDVTEHTISIKN